MANSVDFWDALSAIEKASIQRAIQQLNDGKGISHEDVMKEFRTKYTKN